MRIMGLSSSETEYTTQTTGVGGAMHYFFKELGKRAELVELYQPRPHLLSRAYSLLSTYQIGNKEWKRAYKRHGALFRAKSRLCRKYLEQRAVSFDLIFQWQFFFSPTDQYPSTAPYCLYNDWTTKLNEREYPHWVIPKIRKEINELQTEMLQQAACVFAFTDKVRMSYIHDYGVHPDRAVTVWGGINMDKVPERIHKAYGSHHILFVGNNYSAKGLDTLLQAMPIIKERFPGAKATIVGNPVGHPLPPVPGIEYKGIVQSKDQMDALYRQADLFVLPTRNETFGHVFAEAMAYQLPCIGTLTGGVPEVIDDGRTGLLLQRDDVSQLVQHITHLFEHPDRMKRMGDRGYDKAISKFTWEKVVDRMEPYLYEAASYKARNTPDAKISS